MASFHVLIVGFLEQAPNMYELWNMKNRPLKWGLATVGLVGGGFGIPVVAVLYQQEKAKG
jgi:hypothetical protein